jgi:DNA (cytosine-5)-methyltransferase 1
MRVIEVADLFAGAGGMTTGAYMAAAELGLSMRVVAVNHWKAAIATHKRNHPDAAHFEEPVERVAPHEAVPGGRLDLLMAAPECIYHSNARADRPINDQRRSTAWGIMNWPSALHIDRILIENVPQFRKWGDRTKDGSVYRAFLRTLEAFGFVIDERVLCAADYGDATTRERLFIQGVRPAVGRIVWPEPTHAEQSGATLLGRNLKPWRPAAEVIDWTIKSRSIFDRPKALAPATMNRIEIGLRRCNGRPFLIPQHGGGYPRSVDDPMPTIATAAAIGLVQPILVPYYGNGASSARPVSKPIATITTRDRFALITPTASGDVTHRFLQPHELSAATGFPVDYEFVGTKRDVLAQIGNAVCLRTARAIVREMIRPLAALAA